jgi:transcriptional regulator with XRE-family HTH domain
LSPFGALFGDISIMEFWERVQVLILQQNTTQKWVAKASGIKYPTLRGWIAKNRMPSAEDAVMISKALDTTSEELILGKSGETYILDWAGRHGAKWKPPKKIAPIYDDLMTASDECLEVVAAMIHQAAEIERRKSAEA